MAIKVFGGKSDEVALTNQQLPQPLALQVAAGARDRRADVLVPYLENAARTNVLLTEDSPAIRVSAETVGTRQMVVHGNKNHGVDAYLHEDVMLNTTFALPKYGASNSVTYRGADHPKHVSFQEMDSSTRNPFVVKVDMSSFYLTRRFVLASQNTDLTIEFPKTGQSVSMESKYGRNVFLLTSIGDEIEIRREAVFTTDLLKAFSMEITIKEQKIPPFSYEV